MFKFCEGSFIEWQHHRTLPQTQILFLSLYNFIIYPVSVNGQKKLHKYDFRKLPPPLPPITSMRTPL